MSGRLLLPGIGGNYTSEAITGSANGTTGADTLDISRCASFSIEATTVTTPGASTVQVQQTFDMKNWANLGSPVAISLGMITLFGPTSGPYGVIRLVVTDAAAAVVATFVITGWPRQNME